MAAGSGCGPSSRRSASVARRNGGSSEIEWREPKVMILFEIDEKGRMVRGSRPVIDGTLQGPDALIELVAFHLHRLGAAKAKVVIFAGRRRTVDLGTVGLGDRPGQTGTGAGGRGARLVPRRASPEPGVGGLGSGRGSACGSFTADFGGCSRRARARPCWPNSKTLAKDQSDDSPVWREIRYLRKHSEAGRLRYDCFRYRGLPMGSGAIESTIRRVINLRLKGNSIYWTEDNAEAVFQLRAAVVSGRWEEIVEHTQAAMAKDRRTNWHWTPPECLAELKALDEENDDLTQPSTKKQAKRSAA